MSQTKLRPCVFRVRNQCEIALNFNNSPNESRLSAKQRRRALIGFIYVLQKRFLSLSKKKKLLHDSILR